MPNTKSFTEDLNKRLITPPMNKGLKDFKKKMREAIANYMRSEGCGCCGNYEAHIENKERLGKLLNVSKYKDGSGYDFSKYQTK